MHLKIILSFQMYIFLVTFSQMMLRTLWHKLHSLKNQQQSEDVLSLGKLEGEQNPEVLPKPDERFIKILYI